MGRSTRVLGIVALLALCPRLCLGDLVHQWTFNGFPSDSAGTAHGKLEGNAQIDGDRLVIDGTGGSRFLSGQFGHPLLAKTLVAWVSLQSLDQRPGSVLTVEDSPAGDIFDAIVLGERVPGQWMAGSNFFLRTTPDNLGAPETLTDPDVVMLAIAYGEDSTITIYRDGEEYASAVNASFGAVQSYCEGAVAQIGPRHGMHADVIAAWIDEARVYDTALSVDEVQAIFEAGPSQEPNESMEPGGLPPVPVELLHQWTFNEGDAADSVGSAHGFLGGSAVVENGRLLLDGLTGSGMFTDQIAGPLSSKTLVSWASLATLDQVGGSILTVEDTPAGNVFDAIVFGERVPRQWMAGSNFFLRTVPDNGGPVETALEPDEVMIAIVYKEDSTIAIYRDGEEYASAATASQGSLVSHCQGYAAQIGPRHGQGTAVFNGWVNEARIYRGALSADEVRELFEEGHAGSSKSTVVRSFGGADYRTGETVHVSLAIEIRDPERAILLTERVPSGLTPAAVSDGGVINAGVIEWDLAAIDSKTVSYEVAPGTCSGPLGFGPSGFRVGDKSGRVTGPSRIDRALDPKTIANTEWQRANVGAATGAEEPFGDHGLLVQGTGGGVKGTEDEIRFVHLPLSGDWELSASIECADDPPDDTSREGLAGLMVRDTLDPFGATILFAVDPPAGGLPGTLRGFVRRETSPTRSVTLLSLSDRDVTALPVHLRMKRAAGKISLERSADGVAYTEIGSRAIGTSSNQIALGDQALAGLAVSGGTSAASFLFGGVSGPAFQKTGDPRPTFRRGDSDSNGNLDLSDPIALLNHLFLGGDAPECLDAADVNDDGRPDISDAVASLGYQFLGAVAPADPGPLTCGPDPTAEAIELGCLKGC